MSIDAVVFDIGNVLIEWVPERFYDRVIGPERRRAMFADVDLHAMNEEIDIGASFQKTVYDCAARYPQWQSEIRMWHDNWLELAAPEIPVSVACLRALRARGMPVFALSNFGIGTFELAETAYPFLTEFDRRFISGYLSHIKPHARIYEILETDSGIAPDTLLFADDRADNIAAAHGRGWQTHLFTTPDGWQDRLVSEGLLQGPVA